MNPNIRYFPEHGNVVYADDKRVVQIEDSSVTAELEGYVYYPEIDMELRVDGSQEQKQLFESMVNDGNVNMQAIKEAFEDPRNWVMPPQLTLNITHASGLRKRVTVEKQY